MNFMLKAFDVQLPNSCKPGKGTGMALTDIYVYLCNHQMYEPQYLCLSPEGS